MCAGRPKKMSIELKKILKRLALKFPQVTAAALQNSVLELCAVSDRTT
jgi:hypothetical protein